MMNNLDMSLEELVETELTPHEQQVICRIVKRHVDTLTSENVILDGIHEIIRLADLADSKIIKK